MIVPEWQGLGLGIALQQRLKEFAVDRGVRGFSEIVRSHDDILDLGRLSPALVGSSLIMLIYRRRETLAEPSEGAHSECPGLVPSRVLFTTSWMSTAANPCAFWGCAGRAIRVRFRNSGTKRQTSLRPAMESGEERTQSLVR
jgi:hypothetical protein